jgi:hypothetical protein
VRPIDSPIPQFIVSERASWDYWRVCRWLIVWKATFFLVAFICLDLWAQWEMGSYESERHWPLDGECNLASRFVTWDASHFLYLAKNGYQKGDTSSSLFPLYPALIRGASYAFGGNLLAAALALTQALSILAVLTVHRLAWEMFGTGPADWTAAFVIAFPGAIFLSFPYSEALSVALASLFLLYLHRGQILRSSVTGFFLALSSTYGILCLFPLVWRCRKASKAASALLLYGPIVGFGLYFFLCYQFTGNPTEGFDVPRAHSDRLAYEKMISPTAITEAAVNIGSAHGRSDSALDRIFFLLLLGSLPFIWRLNKGLFWFALPFGLIPAFSGLFQSFSRHIMQCLPLFMLLGIAVSHPDKWWIRRPLFAALAALQLWFLVRHLNFMWAG